MLYDVAIMLLDWVIVSASIGLAWGLIGIIRLKKKGEFNLD